MVRLRGETPPCRTSRKSNFNSCMVRLRGIRLLYLPMIQKNFNSCMVRLRGVFPFFFIFLVLHFNSCMVRLRAGPRPKINGFKTPFQFLHGAIKGCTCYHLFSCNSNFNSCMVRLGNKNQNNGPALQPGPSLK